MNGQFVTPVEPVTRGILYRLLAFAFRHPFIVAFTCMAVSLTVYVAPPFFLERGERLIVLMPLIFGVCLLFLLIHRRMLLARHIDDLLRQAVGVCRDRVRFRSTFPYCLGRHSQTPSSDASAPDDSATLARILKTLEAARAVNRKGGKGGASPNLERHLLNTYREIHDLSGFRDAQGEALKSLLARALTHFYFARHDLDAFCHAIRQTRKHNFRQQELVIFRERLPEAPPSAFR